MANEKNAFNLELRSGIWYWRKMIKGRKFNESTNTSDFALAKKVAKELERKAVSRVHLGQDKDVMLHDAIRQFIRSREHTKGYANMMVHMRFWQAMPNCLLRYIDVNVPQTILTKRLDEGMAGSTVRVTGIYWNAFLNFCLRKGWTVNKEALTVSLPDALGRIRILSKDELFRFFRAIDPNADFKGSNKRTRKGRQDNLDLCMCLLHLGLRYNEVARMTWDQIDFENKQIAVRRLKRGQNNSMVMSDALLEIMTRRKSYEEDSTWLFPNKRSYNNNNYWMKKALREAGISQIAGRVTLHTLRHTAATTWLRAGLSLLEVQAMLGHKQIKSTLCYAHIQADAVAIKTAAINNMVFSAVDMGA